MNISPTSIIERIRMEYPNDAQEILSNPQRVRKACLYYHPNIDFRTVESAVRIAREYKNRQTPLEKKLKNSIVTFNK